MKPAPCQRGSHASRGGDALCKRTPSTHCVWRSRHHSSPVLGPPLGLSVFITRHGSGGQGEMAQRTRSLPSARHIKRRTGEKAGMSFSLRFRMLAGQTGRIEMRTTEGWTCRSIPSCKRAPPLLSETPLW